MQELINKSEARYNREIARVVDRILDSEARVVLLSGPSGSGKTTSAKRIVKGLKSKGQKSIYLSMDEWFKTVDLATIDRDEFGNPDYESPCRVDIDLLNRQINELLEGKEKQLFLDYVNAWSAGNAETAIGRFTFGFKVGARITAESLNGEL